MSASGKQGSGVVSNGQPSGTFSVHPVHSSSSPSTEHRFIHNDRLKEAVEETPVIQIEVVVVCFV